MAIAAARAAAYARAKKKQQLLERTKKATMVSVSNEDTKLLMEELQENKSSRYLADLLEGKIEKKNELVRQIAENLKYKEVFLPTKRPHFLSRRHFAFLRDYFDPEVRIYDPRWLSRYFGANPEIDPSEGAGEETKEDAGDTNDTAESNERGMSVDRPPKACDDNPRGEYASFFVLRLNELVLMIQVIADNAYFANLVIAAIISAGIIVGIQSYPAFFESPALDVADLTVQCIFTAECILKILQEGPRPYMFWIGPERAWNNFDFWIVLVCWIPIGGNVAFIRLMRLMRLVKLVGKVKQLQIIVMGLVNGLNSVTYILILLFLVFYLFAVFGVSVFRKNDPFHFGTVPVAMLSLFRIATIENWSPAMYIDVFGCASQYSGAYGWYTGGQGNPPYIELGTPNKYIRTGFGSFPKPECWSSAANPVLGTCFHVVFIIFSTYVLLSLFIGAVCGGMADTLETFEKLSDEEKTRVDAKLLKASQTPTALLLSSLRDFYDSIDEDGSGEVDEIELSIAMREMGQANITSEIARAMIASVDTDGSGTLGFSEFVFIMTDGELDGEGKEHGIEAVPEKIRERPTRAQLIDSARIAEEIRLRPKCIRLIREAWGHSELTFQDRKAKYQHRPLLYRYILLADKAKLLAAHPVFTQGLTITILCAGVLVGAQIELATPGSTTEYPVLDIFDTIILSIFTFDVGVKIIGEGDTPWRYFTDAWNRFDFFIVFACYAFGLPFMPDVSSLVQMLRLLRLLRVLKLVKALPNLQQIVEVIISSASSISFVTIILFMFFYLLANIGMIMFAANDPEHFGRLQFALLTLFRQATTDNWSDVMYVNMLGCDNYLYFFGSALSGGKAINNVDNCNNPQGFGWIAAIFFVFVLIIGGFVLLTLFIGIVATSMEEAKAASREEGTRMKRLGNRMAALGIEPGRFVDPARELFDILSKGESKIYLTSIKPLTNCVGEIFEGAVAMNKLDLDKMYQVLKLGDEHFHHGDSLEFPEFIVVLDYMRRFAEDPEFKGTIRDAFKKLKANAPPPEAGGINLGQRFTSALGNYTDTPLKNTELDPPVNEFMLANESILGVNELASVVITKDPPRAPAKSNKKYLLGNGETSLKPSKDLRDAADTVTVSNSSMLAEISSSHRATGALISAFAHEELRSALSLTLDPATSTDVAILDAACGAAWSTIFSHAARAVRQPRALNLLDKDAVERLHRELRDLSAFVQLMLPLQPDQVEAI